MIAVVLPTFDTFSSAKLLQRVYRAKRLRIKLHEIYVHAIAERRKKEEHRRQLVCLYRQFFSKLSRRRVIIHVLDIFK